MHLIVMSYVLYLKRTNKRVNRYIELKKIYIKNGLKSIIIFLNLGFGF